MIRVLGIDPGTHRIGWGVVEGSPSRCNLVGSDCLEFPPGTKNTVYLEKISNEIEKLIQTYHPDLVSVEQLFFQTNVKTAMSVAEARGAIILAIAKNKIPYVEYAPNTIKATVAGDGGANKAGVERMIGLLLGMKVPKLDDTADALATAITAIILNK